MKESRLARCRPESTRTGNQDALVDEQVPQGEGPSGRMSYRCDPLSS